jgi:methylmalonyl-CoA mutase C-terminal domain/subunit
MVTSQTDLPGTERPRTLVAKTSLDGHWRGVDLVSRVLRDAGFEVIMLGMATPESIVATALQEDVDLVGLNIGGRVEVAERSIQQLRDAGSDVPVMAGGTIAPWARRRLEERGVEVFPPGSTTMDIVAAARRLCHLPELAPPNQRA